MKKGLSFRDVMVFIILSATVALGYQIPYLKYTFYDQIMVALQLTNTQMSLLTTTIGTTCMICYPIGGFIANRFSARNCMIATLAGVIGVTIWFAFTTNFIMLLIIHVLYGFFTTATLWSAYLSGIRNIGSADVQGKLFGFSEATRGVLQTLCGFLFLAVMGVAASATLGFRYVLLTGAGICAVFLVLAIIYMPKDNKKQDSSVEDDKEHYSMLDVLKHKGVWITTLLIMCAFTSWSLGNNYLTTYTVQVLNISPELASTLGIIRSYIIVLLSGFIGGWVLDKFTYKGKAFALLLGLITVVIVAVMFTSKVVPVCIGLTLVFAFLANVMKSTYWSTMEQAGIPAKMTPLATGFMSLICFCPGDVLLHPLCGIWIDNAIAAGNVAAGFNRIFILLIAFSVLGIVAAIMLVKTKKEMDKNEFAQQ